MTIYNRTIQIRLTREEKDRILDAMVKKGEHNLSACIRKRLLCHPFALEQKVDEIYQYLISKRNKEESRRRVVIAS